MSFFRVFLIVGVLGITLCSSPGCKEQTTDYQREKEYLDSIENTLNTTEAALTGINAAELENRIALINTWYVSLKDTSYDVAQKMQIDFNGFKIVYKKYIDNFFCLQSKLEVLKNDYNNLKKNTLSGKMERSEFKQEYFALKTNLEALQTTVYSITQPVNDLAFSWRRYNNQRKP